MYAISPQSKEDVEVTVAGVAVLIVSVDMDVLVVSVDVDVVDVEGVRTTEENDDVVPVIRIVDVAKVESDESAELASVEISMGRLRLYTSLVLLYL